MNPSPTKTFAIFLVGGFATAVVAVSLWLIADIVRIDFLHQNPHRTREHAALLAVLSPLWGIVFAVFLVPFPLLTSAALAALGRRIFGRLPLWYLAVILLACTFVHQIVFWSWEVRDIPEEDLRPLGQRTLMFLAYQIPALLVCWWWARPGTAVDAPPP